MTRVRQVVYAILLSAVLVLLFASVGHADGISGEVRDEQGGVLPGATITIENLETGITRTVVSSSDGLYVASNLSAGTYDATVSLTGFATVVRKGVTLTVGEVVVIDFVLKIGEVSEEVLVVGETPLVNTTSAGVSGLVDERAIRDLPLVTRSWDQLITLQSGATVFRPIANQSASQGFGQKFTISGQRVSSNLFYQDGTELGGAQRIQGLPGSAAGVNLGVEGIREFRVLTSSYSPEYGKKAGGAIITITKSGTNTFHGSVFEFYRNDSLDTRNFFAVGKNPFTRNNFGGAVGGPVVHNRSFFFGNYEGLRESLATPFSVSVPSEAARRGFLPGPDGQLQFVGVAPAIQPFLQLWPLPNARDFGDGTAAFQHAPTRRAEEDYFLGRFDHTLSEKNFIFVSYTISDAEVQSPLDNPLFFEQTGTREQRATVEHKRVASAQTINVLRFGFHRSFHSIDSLPFAPLSFTLPEFTPGAGLGNIFVEGLANGGPGTQGNTFGVKTSFQLADHLSYFTGKHTFEFGGQFQWNEVHEDPADRKNGQWDFIGVRELILGQPRLFSGAFPPGSTGVLNIGLPLDIHYEKLWKQNFLALYARDQVRWTPNLTLDLGFRYEVLTSPTEADGHSSNMLLIANTPPFNRVMGTTPDIGKKIWSTNWLAGFSPRLGVAWDPFGHATTSVRGGFGIFYDQIDNEFRFHTHINPPFAPRAQTTRADAFPVPWGLVSVGDLRPTGRSINPNLEVPTVMHYNLTIERQVGGAAVFKVGYVGARGRNLLVSAESNHRIGVIIDGEKFWPANAPAAEPLLGGWDWMESAGSSRYDSLQTEFQTRFASSGLFHRLRSKVAYTFSKAVDNSSQLQGTGATNSKPNPLDPFDWDREQGLAAHHTAHLFSVNFTYDLSNLPLGGLAGILLRDWQINSVTTLAAGYPLYVNLGFPNSRNGQVFLSERPSLAPGGDNNPVLGGPVRYFDPAQFVLPPAGTLGNLGRNTILGPGLVTFDMSVARTITAGDRFNVQLRVEAFNLFNRANFGVPDNTIFTSAGTVRGAVGRITTTSTPARQMQLGLKFGF